MPSPYRSRRLANGRAWCSPSPRTSTGTSTSAANVETLRPNAPASPADADWRRASSTATITTACTARLDLSRLPMRWRAGPRQSGRTAIRSAKRRGPNAGLQFPAPLLNRPSRALHYPKHPPRLSHCHLTKMRSAQLARQEGCRTVRKLGVRALYFRRRRAPRPPPAPAPATPPAPCPGPVSARDAPALPEGRLPMCRLGRPTLRSALRRAAPSGENYL